MTTETTPNQGADASTAFLRAARAGQLDKILALLSQDVDINVCNANGLNAIHLASKDGHAEVVAELLKRGAAIDAATKKGNTALHIASLAGQEAVVRLLVQAGAQVNIQSQNGFTPLYMAAQENHDSVVRFLLSNGANQSLATEDGFTPLAVAMQQGHDKVVKVLLESDTKGKVRLPALHIAAKKDDVKAATLLLNSEHNPDVTSKSGFTPLHIAAHYGNEEVAKVLLQKGADVNYPAKHNICPLHVAAKWGKENMVFLLCEHGANIEARTRDGLTPLHCAARSGHERVVDTLISKGAPITSKSKNGLAPLHMAAQGDHAEAARVLLSKRAPVDDVTVDYLTALHVAAHCGHVKAAKLLLDRNADANARALNGFTPLHIACKKNRIKVVELLLKYGASISATTESGLTPLHVAAFMGCMNIVIYLLQHEANPDVPTVRGETPLHLAARANQTDIIRILLRNGAAVDAKARERQTPLHIASRLGNVDIAVLLLQHGADVKAVTADHYNALHIAAKQHNHDVAAALIEHGAPLTATTKKGFTPLHIAAKYGNLKVTNLLLSHGASPDQAGKNGVTPLHIAAQYDQQPVASALLDKGADAKAVAKNGHTPLHIASRKNQMEIAALLLEYGALTNAESKAGFTPLQLAAQQGHTEMCALLLEHGADVNKQATNGLTALHLAAQEDREPVVQLLLKNGAEIDKCTNGGYTPLHVASHYGQTGMVKFLLENGASVKAQTAHGYTALHHGAQQGHINIVNVLLDHKADANAVTENGQTPLDIASKLGYVTIMETLKGVSDPSTGHVTHEKYKVVAPETMFEAFMSDSEEEGGEDIIMTDQDQPYRYLTADDMKSLGDDSLPIDVTRDERAESAIGHKNIMETSQGSINGMAYQNEDVVKSVSHYSSSQAPEGYCYNVDPTQPNFLVSFLVDARGGAMRGARGGGIRVIVPPTSAQQPTRITCRYLKPSRINHMPPLMEGEALAARVLEMGPVSAKFIGPVILEVPHYASLRGKEREIVILRSDNGTSWREHTTDATDEMVQDILHETLEIEDPNDDAPLALNNRVTRILTHDFPQYFAVISRIRQEVHAIGPEGGMVSSSVVPQVQAVFPQGALTKKIKVGLQAQIIDSELTAKLLGRGVAVSPVVTVEPRRRKFHKAITLSMPAPRPHTQGMTNQYSTSSAPTLRLLCSISGGTNRAHWEDVTENTPLTFVNDCVSFTTTVSARYWLIDCRHVDEATKMATELYKEAIHVPFMARFIVYAKRTEQNQAQLRMFCVTDDREDKTLERMERFSQVAKSRDVEVHEGKPCFLEFFGNLVPIAKSGEQLTLPFRAFRENRLAFPAMVKSVHSDPVARCQFMREPRVPKGEQSPPPICALNILVPEEVTGTTLESTMTPIVKRTVEQELAWRQRLSDPRLVDICNLLGKDWVALAYELGVSVATVNQIQAKKVSAAEQAQLMLKLWKTQSGTKAEVTDNSLELALCRIGRDDIIAPQSDVTQERRIQRNIYQERQASEEIEAYKAEEDNKHKERSYDDNQRAEQIRRETEMLEQEESKYSPEEKSVAEQPEGERTPTPSEESEEDEDFKRSVAERKVQITKKLSSSKIPASKQKKEIREEITEIKTQIKPDVKKKLDEIEQQSSQEQVKLERTKSKSSPESVETPDLISVEDIKSPELVLEKVVDDISEKTAKSTTQFKKTELSSPAKPTPKHLQKHARNDSMHRFSSGDFSEIKVVSKKSVNETVETKLEIDTSSKNVEISGLMSEIKSELQQNDGDISPDLVEDEQDIATATLKTKISSFESKIPKRVVDQKPSVKLTKEALKKHTLSHEQDMEYTQEFVRKQAEQVESCEEINSDKKKISASKVPISVKEAAQMYDSKTKEVTMTRDLKTTKSFSKSMRTDSTIVQVSSEEDNEFHKKSTDSETETESQTTVKIDKNVSKGTQGSNFDIKASHEKDLFDKNGKADRVSTMGLDISSKDEFKKADSQLSLASTRSDLSKTHTKTDSAGSDVAKKISQESPDLQQTTDKDVSFISQSDSKAMSKESKLQSDSLDEGSQFSELEDHSVGPSPVHKPIALEKTVEENEELSDLHESHIDIRYETSEFLQHEAKYASADIPLVHTTSFDKISPKESPVISAKARQFIETVPEDDSVQECFFSKRIYSDSLEDSEHTDSRRHSEAESLKSDPPDIRAKVSSLDFDERAEFEGIASSTNKYEDETIEDESTFTTSKYESNVPRLEKDDSDKKIDQSDAIFKKVTPKRHSRSESMSITKLTELTDTVLDKPKREFHMVVTQAEEIISSFERDEVSDRISSESSKEIEVSDKKSLDGISDQISSEAAVTDRKSSSEEDAKLENLEEAQVVAMKESVKDLEMIGSKVQKLKDEVTEKDETKRESIVSTESSVELRLEEKRASDAHSITESRDYTFEESEDSFGAHNIEQSREKQEILRKEQNKIPPVVADSKKIPKISHGDSLDDIEGFPEDHVIDQVTKLPGIQEIVLQPTNEKIVNDIEDLKINSESEARSQIKTIIQGTDEVTLYSMKNTVTEGFTSIKTSVKSTRETVSEESISKSRKDSHDDEEEISSGVFDITKIKTDTLSKIEAEEMAQTLKETEKNMKFDVTSRDHVDEISQDIISKISADVATKSPSLEKDLTAISKDITESEKRSYETRAVKDEIKIITGLSSAKSLETISELEQEAKEDVTRLGDESSKVQIKSPLEMKKMADNIEIVIKQASEDAEQIIDDEEECLNQNVEVENTEEKVSFDSIIEQAITTVEEKLKSNESEALERDFGGMKKHPILHKSLSKDSGEGVIIPRKKHPRTFSVQSSPEEVEEQIYTDSESVSDMDKAKVLEIIEPGIEEEEIKVLSFDVKKIKTDSLDDADELFPEKEGEFAVEEDSKIRTSEEIVTKKEDVPEPVKSKAVFASRTSFLKSSAFKKNLVKQIIDFGEKADAEEALEAATVPSVTEKTSDLEQKSLGEDPSSADLSKLSESELLKDASKIVDTKDFKEELYEDRGTPDISKRSNDLTKDYSKSSVDSKDTSRDFATNELSKDSTVDLTKDFSKSSIESVRDASKSMEEKTISEEHSLLDMSKTLASDASEISTASKESSKFIEEDVPLSRIVGDKTFEVINTNIKSKFDSKTDIVTLETKSDPAVVSQVEIDKVENLTHASTSFEATSKYIENDKKVKQPERSVSSSSEEDREKILSDIKDLNQSDRRCSDLLVEMSQGALIRIDSSHVSHDLSLKFSKTPPPSPIDLINKEKAVIESKIKGTQEDLTIKDESLGVSDKKLGLQPKGSDSSFLDVDRQSPRGASSGGDSFVSSAFSETEAHQSEFLSEAARKLNEAATPKSPTRHLAENLSFVNVDQPTITSGAIELIDRTIEKSIDVIDQIKQEQIAVQKENLEKSITDALFTPESLVSTTNDSLPPSKVFESIQSRMQFQSIDPQTIISKMENEKSENFTNYSTILTETSTEIKKISGHEFFIETRHVSSSDDDSLIIKTEMSHELKGHEHEIREKNLMYTEGNQKEISQKKSEKLEEGSAKRQDIETKTVFKSSDDTEVIHLEREFTEQGLYTGRQTKSEEKMTALKDETVKKSYDVKYSERDLSHEQWGKEYFEPTELGGIGEEDEKSSSKDTHIESITKIIEKDEVHSSSEVSEKGKVVSSDTKHYKEESVIESKEHDDFSSSHENSFKSESTEKKDYSHTSPKSKNRSFKKENEIYEVNLVKEIKISTSPVKSMFSRTNSQDTHSESEIVAELPQDDHKDFTSKSPVQIPKEKFEDQVWEVSVEKEDSFETTQDMPRTIKPTSLQPKISKSSDSETIFDSSTLKEIIKEKETTNFCKNDISSSTIEGLEDMSSTSKELMMKSGESVDTTEYMVKSLESQEAEMLQKSIESTHSAETLHASEFSTEADSALLTGTEYKKDELKLVKERSLEDICSSGYDTDLSSAEFQGAKLEHERANIDFLNSSQVFTDLSVLEKTIDEVKQSLEAAQVEIISEKNDGSSKYKQSPSEFEFKLISPDKPESIAEESSQPEETNESKPEKESEKTVCVSPLAVSDSTITEEDTKTVQENNTTCIEINSTIIESGPHSIIETGSEVLLDDKDDSQKGSPEIKLRVSSHHKSRLVVAERRSASEIEGWSGSSSESHYQSFDKTESRPLSSDIENMMTAQSGTDFETALTTQGSSGSLRTSKDYYTPASSLASRESMRSLDSDGSSHLASIDISDASETLVPSANELKEELMESATFVEQFMHEGEFPKGESKEQSIPMTSSDEEFDKKLSLITEDEQVSKMKRSHEMRFQPKELIPEHFPSGSMAEFDSSTSDSNMSKQYSERQTFNKENVESAMIKVKMESDNVMPFKTTPKPVSQREFVDLESQIISVGTVEYEKIALGQNTVSYTPKLRIEEDNKDGAYSLDGQQSSVSSLITPLSAQLPKQDLERKTFNKEEIEPPMLKVKMESDNVTPFKTTPKPVSEREFVDLENQIISVDSAEYENIALGQKTVLVTSKPRIDEGNTVEAYPIDSQQSSGSSLKTALSAPSQSSDSTDVGKEYVLDDIYDISETPEIQSHLSKSELMITTEEKTLHEYSVATKDQDSPTSDEFEIVDQPGEIDDFVVIEEVAREAQETDAEGKSVKIKTTKHVKKHDEEVEEYLSKASKKSETELSTSGSLSDEDYELEQKRLRALEIAEIEAGKRWVQMQFEGDPRYDYERVPLEDIKEEEMTDFDASRMGSLSSQKESVGSFGSFKNSYGSLSESEMMSRRRFMVKGEHDDVSISSLQEFENLEKALMEQYQQNSSSSQDSLNGSLPKKYQLSKSFGDDVSVSSLKEFEGLESACIDALKAEILAKQKEALLLSRDPKDVCGGFLEHEKRTYSGSSESSPPQKGGSPSQKSQSPSQKSGSPSQKSGSPGQRFGSPSQKPLLESAAIRELIDQKMALEQQKQEILATKFEPKVIKAGKDAEKKYDEKGAFYTIEAPVVSSMKPIEITEECEKISAYSCVVAPRDSLAESLPGDCEEMMKILDQQANLSHQSSVTEAPGEYIGNKGVVDQTSSVEKSSDTRDIQGVNIPRARKSFSMLEEIGSVEQSFTSEVSSSVTSQQSDMDSIVTIVEKQVVEDSSGISKQRLSLHLDKSDELELRLSEYRELSPSSARSTSHTVISSSSKHFTDPASGSWEEELSSSGSFSRGALADPRRGSNESLEASSNATRVTTNYEVDTPMTGSLTSGGSNTMVSSLDTLDPVTAVHMESREFSPGRQGHPDYEVQEPDSDTERMDLDGKVPKTKERTIMFDSTDTLSAVSGSGDGSVREATVETPAATFFIGDRPIVRGGKTEDEEEDEDEKEHVLAGSCPASLPPVSQPSPPIPAQRRSLTMIMKSSTSEDEKL